MSEYNIQMNKYNALNAGYDQLYPKPMKHANTHAKDGSDPILPSSIGAYSKEETDALLANKPSKSPVHVDDANDVTKSGFYTCKTNIPFGYGLANVLAVGDIDDPNNIFTQIAFGVNLNPVNRNAIAVRCYVPGEGFKDWEWFNPPMTLGVEYRTTERYQGKPVYEKAVYCGSLPATAGGTTITNTGIDLSVIDMRLTCIGCMYTPDSRGDKRSLPYNDGSILVSINHSKTGRDSEGTAQDSITIYTKSAGLGAYTAYALIKYTKYDN